MRDRMPRGAVLVLCVTLVLAFAVASLSMPAAAKDEPVGFTEVGRSGIAWPDYAYRDSTWGGGAWGDYNDDGWLDILLPCHPALATYPVHANDSALLRNGADGTFTNVIYESGIKLQEDWHDTCWIDYDDDGDLDLWRSVGGRGGEGEGSNSLSRQNADGSFTEVAPEAGIDYPRARGRGTAWFDYDGDGDLDLYFAGAELDLAPNTMFRNNGDGTFTDVGQLGTDTFVGANSQVSVADYDLDGDQDLLVTGYGPRLYRNDDGAFTNVSVSAGIIDTGGAQGAAWGDYDNDGDLDLYIGRGSAQSRDYAEVWDPPQNSELRFVTGATSGDEDGLDLTATGSITFEFQTRMGNTIRRDASIASLGPDGRNPSEYPFTLGPDDVSDPPPAQDNVFRVWQNPQGSWHLRWTTTVTRAGFSGIITAGATLSDIVEVGFEIEDTAPLSNTLFRNNGDGTFTDVALSAGVDSPLDCRGVDWGDLDNDGDLDLFVQAAGTMAGNAPDLVYRNNGDGTFTDIAAQVNLQGTTEGMGWGGLWGDYNRDGFLDLITHHESWSWPLTRGGYELYANGGNDNHWLGINLWGGGVANGASNRRGHGAKVWITAAGQTQYRAVDDNSHYLHHYSGPIHVGLGGSTLVDELRILWPSGLEQVLENVPADQYVTVFEGGAPTPNANAGGSYSGDEASSISLDGSGSSNPGGGGSLTYAWDLDDDGSLNDAFVATPSYTWNEPGIYTVTLVVTNTDNVTSTDTAQVTVANLAPTAVITGPQSALVGQAFTLDGSESSDPGGGTVLSFAWDLDGDSVFDDATGPVVVDHRVDQPQVYTVRLRVRDSQGMEDTAQHTIRVGYLLYLPVGVKGWPNP
jgi:hypothetical protein